MWNMTEIKELLQKPLQSTWHKMQKPERGEELAGARTWGKTAAEKTKRQCWKYLVVYVDGYNCKKPAVLHPDVFWYHLNGMGT